MGRCDDSPEKMALLRAHRVWRVRRDRNHVAHIYRIIEPRVHMVHYPFITIYRSRIICWLSRSERGWSIFRSFNCIRIRSDRISFNTHQSNDHVIS